MVPIASLRSFRSVTARRTFLCAALLFRLFGFFRCFQTCSPIRTTYASWRLCPLRKRSNLHLIFLFLLPEAFKYDRRRILVRIDTAFHQFLFFLRLAGTQEHLFLFFFQICLSVRIAFLYRLVDPVFLVIRRTWKLLILNRFRYNPQFVGIGHARQNIMYFLTILSRICLPRRDTK